jgi:Tol biopolymer transport system component
MAYQLGGNVRGPEMQWFDRSGKLLGAVGGPGFHSAPRLSPDGRKLLAGRATKFGNYSDLWVYDLERNLSTRVTFEDEDVSGGIWSHDGRRIIFHARGQQSHSSIYETDLGGEGQKQLVFETGTDIGQSDLSRDGQFLLYLEAGNSGAGGARLWVAPMKGVGKPFPLVGNGSQGFGEFSPDGRWVAYTSQDSGRDEVYVIPFHPKTSIVPGRWQISSSGGTSPRWRSDGKELFFIGADNTLMSVSISNQASGFVASAPRPLFRAGLANTVGAFSNIFDVSRDGKRFIFNFGVLAESKAPITLVQNWLSDLK